MLDDFAFDIIGPSSNPPQPASWTLAEDDCGMLGFSSPIEVGTWLTITHTPSGSFTKIGFLPADVNGDGTSAVPDVLALVDHLNSVTLLPEWSTDIDRSGLVTPADILRTIDLLNGAGAYAAFNGMSLR